MQLIWGGRIKMDEKSNYIKIIRKDIGHKLNNLGIRDSRSLLCKLSYPIAGNLSRNIQEKLEEKLGKENYDGGKATQVSANINSFVTYPLVAFNFLNVNVPSGHNNLVSAGLGLLYGLLEGALRVTGYPNASVVGKAVSLPFDLFTSAKNYLSSVNQRAKVEYETMIPKINDHLGEQK